MSNKGNSSSAYREQVEKLGVISFVPNGVSMWPIIKNRGQSVIVEKKTSRLKKYDVAFYQRNTGNCVLHRVMEVTENGYIMCGDSQKFLEPVEEDMVFGVMTGFYKGEEYVPVTDEEYLKRVERWYARKKTRLFKITLFMFFHRAKNKLKRIFKKEKRADV
jgi:hypothetical protein